MTGQTNAQIVSGGGSGLEYELLADITLTEDKHAVKIDIDSHYINYTDVILDLGGITLSAADWVYPRINSTAVSGAPYTPQLSSFAGLKIGWSKLQSSGIWYCYDASISTTNSGDLSFVNVACYTQNVNILTGSNFKVWGR